MVRFYLAPIEERAEGCGREFTSPVILRERRPAASRPVGEGSGLKWELCNLGVCFFLWPLFLVLFRAKRRIPDLSSPPLSGEATARVLARRVRDMSVAPRIQFILRCRCESAAESYDRHVASLHLGSSHFGRDSGRHFADRKVRIIHTDAR
jgi:hypothetical protein